MVRLVNKLIPGYVKKINTKGGNFALMENIAAVQKGMRQYGVPEDELFQPVDLFEARNIKAVVKSLAALARTVLQRIIFVTRDSIYAIARICHTNSVRPSVCHTRVLHQNG